MRNKLFAALVLVICLWPIPASAEHEQVGEPAVTVQEAVGAPSEQPVPSTLTLPVGTLITVRTTQLVSSDRNRPNDAFTTVLEQPVVARGWVLARRGQIVVGRVAIAETAGRFRGLSELAVELTELVLVDGQQVPIRTHLMTGSGDTSLGRDAEIIGTTTGVGVLVGAAAGGGRGAAIGSAAGAAAGLPRVDSRPKSMLRRYSLSGSRPRWPSSHRKASRRFNLLLRRTMRIEGLFACPKVILPIVEKEGDE